jgi:protein SCO1/2
VKRPQLTIAFAALAILAVGGIVAWRSLSVEKAPEASEIGGPFRLTDETGAPVDQRILKGKWSAVYFGYTFCPDVCPTTLAALAGAISDLGARSKAFQVIFITVDPQRDTPAQLRSYLSSSSFPRGVIGLTGTDNEIKAVAGAYRVYYSRHGGGADYSVDHTSIIYLMDPQGRFVRPIPADAPAAMAKQIAAAMAGG